MMYGKNAAGDRVEASPGAVASCPSCSTELRPKCGEIITWHWAHVANDCDPWSEPETNWHRSWKAFFPPATREVVVGCHRADVKTHSGQVIEFQHSNISTADIEEREQFYRWMVWVFDANSLYTNNSERDQLLLRDRGDFFSFRWKHPRKTTWACTAPTYLDLGLFSHPTTNVYDLWLLKIGKIHHDIPCGGWGVLVSHRDFVLTRSGGED